MTNKIFYASQIAYHRESSHNQTQTHTLRLINTRPTQLHTCQSVAHTHTRHDHNKWKEASAHNKQKTNRKKIHGLKPAGSKCIQMDKHNMNIETEERDRTKI